MRILSISLISTLCISSSPYAGSPSFATGIKIGEVTPNSALVWARLSSVQQADPGGPSPVAPGSTGAVRLRYWPDGEPGRRAELNATPVSTERDHTCRIPLTGLTPHTTYLLEAIAYSAAGVESGRVKGRFKTPPAADTPSTVNAVLVTCQGHETIDNPRAGHWVYQHMLTHDPDFFVHTGDVVYYDKSEAYPASKTVPAARERWNRMFAYTWNRDFHAQVSSYFMKDDHDTLKNDCWPGQTYGDITWEEGLALFKEQTPQGALPYRRVRWGQDLELWLMEGRDYRTPNPEPDGPNKTLLGKEQKAWLKRTLSASDATFKLVVFPSPVVGPDKKGKRDNHSNATYAHEGRELRQFLAQVPNAFVVCGDRHWQYASKDPQTGLVEICTGPINNAHALRGGNAKKDPAKHLYYGGGKGGYLRVVVNRNAAGIPRIDFHWHGDRSVDGAVNHTLGFDAAKP